MSVGRRFIFALAVAVSVAALAVASEVWAGDPIAGNAVFEKNCHGCHAALPYTGRIGDANLSKFLANPKGYKPTTAMTFPGLRNQKDIDDVIAFITKGH